MIAQILLHNRVVRYVRLRPSLMWSLASLALFTALLFIIQWNEESITIDRTAVTDFQMVELRLPQSVTQPDIDISDDITEEVVEEKKEEKKEEPLRFGDESGEYGDMFDTAVPPRPIYNALPQYPASMRKAGIEGVVVIEIGIDRNGNVLYGRIIQSLGREFDLVVLRWARTIRFHPALSRDREAIRSRVRFPVRFRLED